ncbi:hypothetical protein [Streptomyces lavendulae]|nr:hypothetical protein [Streptomyces lavendulae]
MPVTAQHAEPVPVPAGSALPAGSAGPADSAGPAAGGREGAAA